MDTIEGIVGVDDEEE